MSVHALPTVRVKSDDPEHNGHILINESDFNPDYHELFDPPPSRPALPGLPPLPTAAAPDPLAGLTENWREDHGARLKSLAMAVSGRSVENKEQAISVIEAALAARAK